MSLNPLAIIRPERTRGPWTLVTRDGGLLLFQSRSWDRCLTVARAVLDVAEWDHHIDGEAPC